MTMHVLYSTTPFLFCVLDVPNVVITITDGQSNVNHELTLPEARRLKVT